MKAIKHTPAKNRSLVVILSVSGIVFLLVFLHVRNSQMVLNQTLAEPCESVSMPVFSVPEGIYDNPFELEIFAPDGYTILYTTDGSTPTITSKRYKRPINVDPQVNLNKKILNIPTTTTLWWKPPVGTQNHSTVIRARCFKKGTGYGKVRNVIYSNSTIRQHGDFQVVHILIEADSLFHPARGIYVLGEEYYSKRGRVEFEEKIPKNAPIFNDEMWWWSVAPANYHLRGIEWTRPAAFILLDKSGKTSFEQNITIRIHGRWSRAFNHKSLRITSDSFFHHSFFDDLPYQTFKHILLRNSGQDLKLSLFRDAMLQELVRKCGVINLDLQAFAPSVVYINGVYWGIHNIRERQEEDYLSIKYGSSMEKISIVEYKRNHYMLRFGDDQALQSFEELIHYINENPLFNKEKAYQHVSSQIDIDNFIDYMIVQTYFANEDWADNNARLYRIDAQTEIMKQQNIEAGKWRWFLLDLDLSMYSSSFNTFDYLKDVLTNDFFTPLFFGLMENPEFKEKFLSRYEYIIEICFCIEKFVQHIEAFEELYESEIEKQVARWHRPQSVQAWRRYVNDLKVFARERHDFVREQLKNL